MNAFDTTYMVGEFSEDGEWRRMYSSGLQSTMVTNDDDYPNHNCERHHYLPHIDGKPDEVIHSRYSIGLNSTFPFSNC
jgi:hypothetical protein